MPFAEHLVFSVSFYAAALSVATLLLLYAFMSLAQLTTLLGVLLPASPDQSPNELRQLVASLSQVLIGGEVPTYLNQSAFAVTTVLVVLVVLLTITEEALLRTKEKVRQWGKLPSPEVLHHYNRNSYDIAIAKAGAGFVVKKPM